MPETLKKSIAVLKETPPGEEKGEGAGEVRREGQEPGAGGARPGCRSSGARNGRQVAGSL